ncbi:unnamed protein product [Closterium sp. NIES-54]
MGCNRRPLYTRGKPADLMFETYGVPALAFGVDGVFSYRHNTSQHHSVPSSIPDGLLVDCGHSTTHVMPMIAGQPLLDATCRIPVGGWHVTDYLKRLLTLLYPQHASVITWERAEEMKCRSVSSHVPHDLTCATRSHMCHHHLNMEIKWDNVAIMWERAEEIKCRSMYVAMDYVAMDYVAMDYVAMDYVAMDYVAMDYVAMDYVAMDYVAMDYVA